MPERKWLIRLPWPSPALSSNSKAKLRKRISAKKTYRESAFWLTKEQKVPSIKGAILTFTYHQPDNRSRDCQNMPWPLKHAIDGIALAMGCDDKKFRCRYPDQFAENVKGGCIFVEVSEPESQEISALHEEAS